MAYFKQITDGRRFVGPTGEIIAIYDKCRAYTLYAPVGTDEHGDICFVGEPRAYFTDQLMEIEDYYRNHT